MNIKTVTLARMFLACGRLALGETGMLASYNAGRALALRAIHGEDCPYVAACYLEARRLLVQSIREKNLSFSASRR